MMVHGLFPTRRRVAAFATFIGAAVLVVIFTTRPGPSAHAASSGGTVRVVIAAPYWQALDPQASWGPHQFEPLRCCLLRTLMTYRGVPGSAGTEPVPDLADGPPSVSADGRTWTFHLKRGIHYAPPLADVEVTSKDIVRALMRSDGEQVGDGPGMFYLPLIEGFSEYEAGEADTIDGVTVPDKFTLRVRTVRPDTSLAHVFALAATAPIPPWPGDPAARFGVASGHPFITDEDYQVTSSGYGPFLVSTGPYMFEGSSDVDFSAPVKTQVPAAGAPAWVGDDFRDHITLVRNPSWDPGSDPNRPALADRIEIKVVPLGAALNPDSAIYRELEAGAMDVVVGVDPPGAVVRRYRSSAALQEHILTSTPAWSLVAEINVAQPPFDDRHVRRAVAMAVNRPALVDPVKSWWGATAGEGGTHVIPDPEERSLLAQWDPFDSASGPDLAGARAAMDASRYGRHGRCAGRVCRGIVVVAPTPEIGAIFRAGLVKLGISPVIRPKEEVNCAEPRVHVGICVGGWAPEYPDAGNFLVPWRSSGIGSTNVTLLGASPDDLRKWGYSVRRVPSIDADYERCAAQGGVRATLCWARLDQLMVAQFAAVIPLLAPEIVRVTSLHVAAAPIDQANAEPALDRIALNP